MYKKKTGENLSSISRRSYEIIMKEKKKNLSHEVVWHFAGDVKVYKHWTLLVFVKGQSSHLVYLNVCIK